MSLSAAPASSQTSGGPVEQDRAVQVMVLGIGSFAHGIGQTLKENGAEVCSYLTRDYGHFPATLVGPTWPGTAGPGPGRLIRERGIELVIPQSIDWAQRPWAEELLRSGAGILSPTGEAMRIERERDFARRLCTEFNVPFPASFVAASQAEAEELVHREQRAFVIKNPLCSPNSPIHTILCETPADTLSWLGCVNYAEGVFLQEYAGRAEAGHIVLVSGGEIHSLVTNQEYKRAFTGNLGIVAGAPLGGLAEADPGDKYGLARELIHPLRPWFRAVNYHGPLQVTAVKRDGRWCVLEYNIRIGVTTGAMILRLLANPLETFVDCGRNRPLAPRFRPDRSFGCSVTLGGYGYPYTQVAVPHLPVDVIGEFDRRDADLWWNEVARDEGGRLHATGHRLADAIGYGANLETAIACAYGAIRRLRSPGSYYRTDIGRSLWPPGHE